ncbi:hypothetical protein [Kiritimatiella glycovorans]|uniref:Uncharacterized protein n=1 Tax=Kiritimatiella glycovorans TaxID=1307763 RepID=A0A0G3EJ36_9BACT|nr:hypothetical protein [Kiritimatiella glycovorans]AKJ65447.1 hypothetical protein L21SP4_02220 [Kiritimatiella glycovorans]
MTLLLKWWRLALCPWFELTPRERKLVATILALALLGLLVREFRHQPPPHRLRSPESGATPHQPPTSN